MSNISLSITGLEEDMTSEEVKQKLAKLYNVPEEHFDGLCRSLLIMHEPYVLLKEIDQATADAHVKRLSKIGFTCSVAEEMGGLSLAPVAEAKAEETICPACDQKTDNSEICDHCGVIMEKFLKQKNFDEQFQMEMNATASSQEKMREIHAENKKRQQKRDLAKKTSSKAGTAKAKGEAPPPKFEQPQIRVDSREKTSTLMYAVVASVGLVIVGTGYVAYELWNKKSHSDDFMAKSVAEPSVTSDTALNGSQSLASAQQNAEAVIVEKTVFEKQLQRQRGLKRFGNHLRRLHEEDMLLSAAGLINGKEDSRDRIYGNLEMIKLEGFNLGTAKKLVDTRTAIDELDRDVDRIDALLHQADVYRQFELPEEAADAYDEASRIAFEGTGSVEEKILAEITIAEHQLKHGDPESARERYELAKVQATEHGQSKLADGAFAYIARSQAVQGLLDDASTTNELISNAEIRDKSLVQISTYAAKLEASEDPEQAAAHELVNTGDSDIDELIEMTMKNKKTLEAASGLLGQKE